MGRFCACLGCLSLSALDISNGQREKRGPESHLRLPEVPSEVKRSHPSVSPRQTFIYITCSLFKLCLLLPPALSRPLHGNRSCVSPTSTWSQVWNGDPWSPSEVQWCASIPYFNIAIAWATLVGWQSSARYRPQRCIGISVWVKNLKRFYKILLKFFWCQHKLICRIEKAWYYMLNGVCTRLPFSKHSYSEQTVSLWYV